MLLQEKAKHEIPQLNKMSPPLAELDDDDEAGNASSIGDPLQHAPHR